MRPSRHTLRLHAKSHCVTMKHFQRGLDNLTCFHVQAFLELLDQCKCNFFKAQGLNLYKQKIEEVVSSWKALQSIGCSLACGANRSAVLEASPLEACGRSGYIGHHGCVTCPRSSRVGTSLTEVGSPEFD